MADTPALERVRKALRHIWFCLFAAFFSIYFVYNSMLFRALEDSVRFAFLNVFSGCAYLTIAVACASVLCDYLAARQSPQRRQAALICLSKLALIAASLLFMVHFSCGYDALALGVLVIFAVSANGQSEDRLFGTGFALGAVYTAILFVLSLLGVVANIRGNAFGFIYSDHAGCFMLCLTLFYCILRDGWLTWLEELALLATPFACLLLNDAKTAFVCGLLVCFGTLYRHYTRLGAVPFQERLRYGPVIPLLFRAVYFPVALAAKAAAGIKLRKTRKPALLVLRYGYIICGGLFILATLTYPQLRSVWDRIPGLHTVCMRLDYGHIGFENFPVRLLGSIIPQIGNGASETSQQLYFFLDSGYIKVLLEYGLLIFAVLIGLMTWAQRRLQTARRYYASFLLFIFAVDMLMEFQMICPTNNLFILLGFCALSQKRGVEACEARNPLPASPGKRAAALVLSAVLLAACCTWCTTAYQITAWRGWTPGYAATVVVPGAYIDAAGDDALREPRLTRATQYLTMHRDARCIVNDAADRDWLVQNGVEADRIAVRPAASVDEMLVNAGELIAEEGLPPRLTVCTYDIQQPRVQRRAKALRLPTSSLTMELPAGQYLRNFAAEQWRSLWEN